MLRVLIAIALSIVSIGAQASAQATTRQIYSDNELLAICAPGARDRLARAKQFRCEGYILGVIDTHLLSSEGMRTTPFFCLPVTINRVRLTNIVVASIRESAERGTAASSAVLAAMMDAFPCRR